MSEKDKYQEAFDKLNVTQKRNAISFGSLSDYHIACLKWAMDKVTGQNIAKDNYLFDIYLCGKYTGCEPHGGAVPRTTEYGKWCSERVKIED